MVEPSDSDDSSDDSEDSDDAPAVKKGAAPAKVRVTGCAPAFALPSRDLTGRFPVHSVLIKAVYCYFELCNPPPSGGGAPVNGPRHAS